MIARASAGRARRGARRLRGAAGLLGALLALAPGRRVGAQASAPAPLPASAAGAPSAPAADAVLLRLAPRIGDTLHTRFEQVIRVEPKGWALREGAHRMSSLLVVHGHTSVDAPDAEGWFVSTSTDSVAIVAPDMPARSVEASRRALLASRTRMRVAPDGAMTVLADAARAAFGAGAAGQRLPGTLPGTHVRPGETWVRAVPVPWGATGEPVAPGDAAPQLIVTFRLDSAARDGSRAWIGMQGSVRRTKGTGDATRGTMRGALVVDLARGWVIDSRATFELEALLPAMPGGRPTASALPVHVTVTQRLRAR